MFFQFCTYKASSSSKNPTKPTRIFNYTEVPLIFFRKRRCSCNSNDTSIDRAGPFNRMQPSTNSLASKSPLPADIGQLFCDDSVVWLMVQMVQWGSQNTGDKWCRYILFNHPLPGLRCNFMTGWCFFASRCFFRTDYLKLSQHSNRTWDIHELEKCPRIFCFHIQRLVFTSSAQQPVKVTADILLTLKTRPRRTHGSLGDRRAVQTLWR